MPVVPLTSTDARIDPTSDPVNGKLTSTDGQGRAYVFASSSWVYQLHQT